MIDSPPIRHTKWRDYQIHIIVFILGIFLLFSPVKTSVDHFLYDLALKTQLKQNINHVAIIAIDDKSISQLGQWPWSRQLHGQLLEQLAPLSLTAIGYDVLFTGASLDPAVDQSFAKNIALANNVVLAAAPSAASRFSTGEYELLPTPVLAQSAQKIGHVDFEIDNDGTIRKAYLFAGYKETKWPAFSLALAELQNPNLQIKQTKTKLGNGWVRDQVVHLTYRKTIQDIDIVSYVDVINGLEDMSRLKNKVVLIGMTASAMGDRFITPTSPPHSTTPGVIVNAVLINDLLNGVSVTPLSNDVEMIINAILILLTLILFLKVSINLMLPTVSALIILELVGVAVAYNVSQLWLSPTNLIAIQCMLYAIFVLVKSNQLFTEVNILNHNLVHDRVTGLANEFGLNKQLTTLLRLGQHKEFHLFAIKLGKFKGINDLLGTEAGDELLNKAKSKLHHIFPNALIMARFHGAEFSICVPKTEDIIVLKRLGQAVIEQFSAPFAIQNQLFKLPVSVGIATYPVDASHRRALIEATDTALERALEKRDSNVCIFSHDIKLKLKERAKLESDLARALQEGQIDIYYQPQVEAHSGRIIGAEALARWHHPQMGLVSPDVFIPIAESTGLIIEIGNWILNQACIRAKTIQLEGQSDFRIAVNLSSVQFAHVNLLEEVKNALHNSGLAAKDLELELTESCIVDDINAAVNTLNQLKKLGVSLSIDDFGTGYSSLSYLKHFPMDRIKIDRSFVNSIHDSKNSQEITLAIIAMANSLDMKIIAEGIETIEQQAFLSDNKVDELQGFYFGKPLPVKELEALLKTSQKI